MHKIEERLLLVLAAMAGAIVSIDVGSRGGEKTYYAPAYLCSQ